MMKAEDTIKLVNEENIYYYTV